jgi:hypothetical protein
MFHRSGQPDSTRLRCLAFITLIVSTVSGRGLGEHIAPPRRRRIAEADVSAD